MAEAKKKTAAAPKAPVTGNGNPAPVAPVDTDPVATHLAVSAKKAGFRRAGRAWGTEPTEVSIDEFTDEQIQQLLSDPMLTVLPVVRSEEKK